MTSPTTPTIKYRAACDHCSSTKIKCTQERPQCARCRALGKDCHYSRSLRAGKPPRSSQGLKRKLSNPPVLPRQPPDQAMQAQHVPIYHALTHNISPYPTSTPTKMDSEGAVHIGPYPTPPAIATHYSGGDMPFLSDLHSADVSSSSASPLAGEPEWFFDFNHTAVLQNEPAIPLEQVNHYQQPSPPSDAKRDSFSNSPHAHFSQLELEDQYRMQPATCTSFPMYVTPENDQCNQTALDTLNGLSHMHHAATDAEHSQLSADQIMHHAAHAVQVCQDLIMCPCYKDCHLPVMIGLIASKILACFQALAGIRDPAMDAVPGPGESPDLLYRGDMVVPGVQQQQQQQPPSTGIYELVDDHPDRLFRNHMILGLLQRLGQAIAYYEHTFCDDAVTGAFGADSRLHANMGSFLNTRLAFTMEQISSRMASSTTGSH